MNKIKWIIIILLVVSLVPKAFSGQTRRLSLDEVIGIALKNNLDIKEAQEMITGREAVVGEVKSEWYPNLTLSLGSGYDKTLNVPGEPQTFEFLGQTYEIASPLTSQWSNALSLNLTQNIYTGGRITGSLREAMAGVETVRGDYEIDRQNLVLRVKKSYWELIRAELLVKLREEMVDHYQETLELATSRLSKGAIAPIEVEQARVNLVNEEDNLIQARTMRREVEDELKALIEIGFEAEIRPIDKPDSSISFRLDMDRSVQMAINKRVELARLRQEIEILKGALMVAKSGRYPHLVLRAGYDWAGSDRNYEDAWDNLEATSWNIGLSLNYSIFDGHLTKNKVKEAESNLEVAKYKLKEKEKEIVKEARKAYYQLISAKERIQAIKENVELAQENLRIGKLQFKVGTITSNEVNNYQVSLSEVKTKYIGALIDYEIAKARLEWTMGGGR
ncbi:TolC family protein [bacterium]|nr:TolC family protein [bacterium]